MRKEAEEIRRILFNNGLPEMWISDNTDMSAGRVYYLLGDACKTFDVAEYQMIMDAFEKHGLLAAPVMHSIRDHGLQLGCVTSTQIAEITKAIMMIENHDRMTKLQREKIRNKLLVFKQIIDDEINLVLEHLEEDYKDE